MVIFYVEYFGLVYDWVSFEFWIFDEVKNYFTLIYNLVGCRRYSCFVNMCCMYVVYLYDLFYL